MLRKALALVLLLAIHLIPTRCSSGEVLCREEEKEALLDFKLSFTADPHGYLWDWSSHNPDCCHWGIVECDQNTGHVVTLYVGYHLVSHQLRPSLLVLQHLTELDLSDNSFTMRIPEFIGSLTKLTHLDLSDSGFYGKIPPHLGNLTNLNSLLFGEPSSHGLMHSDNLQWLSRLSSLQWLFLSGVDLSNATDWLSSLKMLPSLSDFECSSCSLPLKPQHHSSTCPSNHSTSLLTLDLSYTHISLSNFLCLINGTNSLTHLTLSSMDQNPDDFFIPLFQSATKLKLFPVLQELDISGNRLTEIKLEQDSSSMSKLQTLDISHNLLKKFPNLSNFSSLGSLDASCSGINENLHTIVHHLSTSLYNLDLSSNFFSDVISDSHFVKLSKLLDLDLSNNYLLTFNFSPSWVPPFQLAILSLRSCKLGPSFPNWILTQNILYSLDISNSSISDTIPRAFWKNITRFDKFDASNNNFHGTLPNLSQEVDLFFEIDLSYNDFHGPIPPFLFSGAYLDLSYNKFSSFHPKNHIVSNSNRPQINLSNNLLSNSLPNWIFQLDGIGILNLAYNQLSGSIPSSIASFWELSALHLNNNMFSGELPSSMKNCTNLMILELGNNDFSGSVPFLFGASLQRLLVLNLRSNNFTGKLPSNLCHLQRLQVLDLSGNRLSGSIPDCVANFTSMNAYQGVDVDPGDGSFSSYTKIDGQIEKLDYASVLWKGMLANESAKSLPQWNVIDLSNNRLTGEIPSGFTSLKYLKSLDLSRNNLNGTIPDKIGHLKYLEVLKLSSNRLHGEIPQSLADLTFLNTLNLSSNNLSGEIPKSTQLQSLDLSSYGGNPELCGEPLPNMCPWDKGTVEPPTSVIDHGEEEGHQTFDFEAFYAALGSGFAFGLLGVFGILNFHAPSRHAFFHMPSQVGDWIFVWTFLCMSRIKRRL